MIILSLSYCHPYHQLVIILSSTCDHLTIIVRSSYDQLVFTMSSSYDHLTIFSWSIIFWSSYVRLTIILFITLSVFTLRVVIQSVMPPPPPTFSLTSNKRTLHWPTYLLCLWIRIIRESCNCNLHVIVKKRTFFTIYTLYWILPAAN